MVFSYTVFNSTNNPGRISADEGIRRNIAGDYRTRCHYRVFTHRDTADQDGVGCDPNVTLNNNGLADGDGTARRWFKRMASCHDTNVRPNHHIVPDI